MTQKSTSLKHKPTLEPLHIYVKWLFLEDTGVMHVMQVFHSALAADSPPLSPLPSCEGVETYGDPAVAERLECLPPHPPSTRPLDPAGVRSV